MFSRLTIAASLLSLPLTAYAHAGNGAFFAGVAHPFFGLDHLAAMLAVGVLASRLDAAGRLMPVAGFVLAALAGASIGLAGWAMPGLERWIAGSVLALGVVLAFCCKRISTRCLLLIVLPWGLFHGNVHALEAGNDPALFVGGFVLGTLALHAIGLLAGLRLRMLLQQAIGIGVTGLGAWLMWGSFA